MLCFDVVNVTLQHFRYLKRKGFIEDSPARRLFNGISSALFYLHSINVAHRDLKLENILLSKDLTPKLSDFGFAKKVYDNQDKSATFCGSMHYSCLEILAGWLILNRIAYFEIQPVKYTTCTGKFNRIS